MSDRREHRLRVALVNNYPMDLCFGWWQDGQIPGQLLWGGPQLGEHGIEVDYVSQPPRRRLPLLGSPDLVFVEQQLRLLCRRSYDVVYAGHFQNASLLSRLRRRGLFRTPLVGVVFMELPAGGASRDQVSAAYSGHDALIALSEPLKDYLVESLGIERRRVHVVPWGAELAFYGEREPVPERPRPLVVSAGKTDRDYATLAAAARGLEADFRIFADLQSVDGLDLESPQIEVLAAQPGRFSVPFSEFVPALRQATVVAIPTRDAPHMPGQTSLFEAMAVGRPVVMTRTRYLPFDIEQEGIGLWVAPADVEGWSKALRFLLERRAEAEAMGARARRLAETYFNIHRYARDVAAILRGVAGR